MIKLYTKPNCPQCVEAKRALTINDYEFESLEIGSPEGMSTMFRDVEILGIDPKSIRSAPVMIADGIVYAGAECSMAVADGEIE